MSHFLLGGYLSATKRHFVTLAVTTFKSETLRQLFLAFVSEQRFTGRPADSLWEIACISSSFALDERAGPQNL